MSLYDDLIKAIPELTDADFNPVTGSIGLRNDLDDTGDYIAKWDYFKPLPAGFKLGK
jgi:hypothetical protein